MPRHQLTVRLTLFLMAICAVFLLIGGAADAGAPPGPTLEYVVRSGDTLWAIASDHSTPGHDVRTVVAAIKEASAISSSTIHPGQILTIPMG